MKHSLPMRGRPVGARAAKAVENAPRKRVRSWDTAIRCSSRSEEPQRLDPSIVKLTAGCCLRLLSISAAASTTAWLVAAPSVAADRPWRRRRHHRHLDQRPAERSLEACRMQREATAQDWERPQLLPPVDSVLEQARTAASSVQGVVGRALRGQPAEQRDYVLSMRAPPRPPPLAPYGSQLPSVAWWLVAGCIGSAGLSLAMLLRRGRGRHEGRAGRWVRDRSLGGKMVFMPDKPSGGPTPLWPADVPNAPATAPRTAPGVAPFPPAQPGASAADAPPEWWQPPPVVPLGVSYKQQAEREASAILRELEDAKLGGADYAVASLVALRQAAPGPGAVAQACGESGAVVAPRTEGGRDALLRAGVEAAAAAAMSNGLAARLGNAAPGRFVAGLARDLGMPQDKAVAVALGAVAQRARATLIDAAAAYREQDGQEELYQLLRLVGLMDALPLPPHSPQASMVAAGLSQKATLPERQAIFLTYGAMEPRTADRVAELLGFNPELVMPQLAQRPRLDASGAPFWQEEDKVA